MCACDLPLWQLNEAHLFSTVPLPLSQGVLLSLVQQLGCDLDKDTTRKLSWIREAALALNPDDPLLAPHMRPFLHQLHQNLLRQMEQTTVSGDQTTVPGEQSNLRLVIHVVRSLLTSCKQWGRCWRILAAAEERGRADPIRKIHKGWSKRRRTRCPRLGSCLVRFRCAWESPRALELVMSVNMEWWWKLGGGFATVCVATEGFDVEKWSIHEFLKLNPSKLLRRFVKRWQWGELYRNMGCVLYSPGYSCMRYES